MTASTHCFVGLDGSAPPGVFVDVETSRWMDCSPRYYDGWEYGGSSVMLTTRFQTVIVLLSCFP